MCSEASSKSTVCLWTYWCIWTGSRVARVCFGPPGASLNLAEIVGVLRDREGCPAIVMKAHEGL